MDIKLIQSHFGLREALSQEIRGEGAGREPKSIGRSRARGEIRKRDGGGDRKKGDRERSGEVKREGGFKKKTLAGMGGNTPIISAFQNISRSAWSM